MQISPKSIKFGAYAKYGHMFFGAIFCLIRITIRIRVPETTNINYFNIQIYLESATFFIIKFLLFFGLSYFFLGCPTFFGLSYLITTFF